MDKNIGHYTWWGVAGCGPPAGSCAGASPAFRVIDRRLPPTIDILYIFIGHVDIFIDVFDICIDVLYIYILTYLLVYLMHVFVYVVHVSLHTRCISCCYHHKLYKIIRNRFSFHLENPKMKYQSFTFHFGFPKWNAKVLHVISGSQNETQKCHD